MFRFENGTSLTVIAFDYVISYYSGNQLRIWHIIETEIAYNVIQMIRLSLFQEWIKDNDIIIKIFTAPTSFKGVLLKWCCRPTATQHKT